MTAQATSKDDQITPRNEIEGLRAICKLVGVPIFCLKTKCRRTNTCHHHHPGHCLRNSRDIVPRVVWDWVLESMRAYEEGLSNEQKEELVGDYEIAYNAWLDGLLLGRHAERVSGKRRSKRDAACVESGQQGRRAD